ncbi:MAG: PEP-CTERM sorting domain-containing protein [Planctomycetota bacterium]
MMGQIRLSSWMQGILVVVISCLTTAVHATTINSNAVAAAFPLANPPGQGVFFFPDEPDDWLLVGTAAGSFGTTVSVNSGFELGAHLPLDGMVPTAGGGQGPDLSGVTKPTGAATPTIGIGLNGDTALTNTSGTFNFQTIDGDGLLNNVTGRSGVYGNTGVQCSQGTGPCTDGNSNTFFNTAGTFPMPNTLLSTSNGINAGNAATLSDLRDGLDDAKTNIPLLPSGGNLPSGSFNMDLTINLTDSGVHVLDVGGSDDWDLGNFDIVVNGPADSFLIVRIGEGVNMLTSNSWIGIGSGGIGVNNVLFFTDQDNNNGHFNFQNTVFNGVAFWDLSDFDGADLAVDNAQGCAQFIAEQIVMNDVRLNWCGASPVPSLNMIPEPSASYLLLAAGVMVTFVRRRR